MALHAHVPTSRRRFRGAISLLDCAWALLAPLLAFAILDPELFLIVEDVDEDDVE